MYTHIYIHISLSLSPYIYIYIYIRDSLTVGSLPGLWRRGWNAASGPLAVRGHGANRLHLTWRP